MFRELYYSIIINIISKVQFLKEQHERGRTSMGITKTGSIEEFNLDEPVAYDFVDVKKRIWSTAVDVAALLLVGKVYTMLYDN
jgi:hypothetical protein